MAKHYLRPGEFKEELMKAKATGVVHRRLAEMFLLLAERCSNHSWYRGYSFREDLAAEAASQLFKSFDRWNPDRPSSPFAYFTTVAMNAIKGMMNSEYKHLKGKRKLYAEAGLDYGHGEDFYDPSPGEVTVTATEEEK